MPRLPFPLGALRILTVEFHERFAFYGTTYILVVYLTDMLKATTQTANIVINLFYFLSPISAIIAAILADGILGKPKVLAFGGAVYTCGIGVVSVSALPVVWKDFPDEPSKLAYGLFYGGITMLGMGYGMIKTCSSPLMAEQLPTTGTEAERARLIDTLFNWFYWVINFGSLFGIVICPLLRNNVGGPKRSSSSEGEYGTGFWTAFLLTFCASFFGLVIYVSGLSSYKSAPIQKGFLTSAVRTVWDRVRCRSYHRLSEAVYSEPTSGLLPTSGFYDQCDVNADLDIAMDASKIFLFLPIFWLLSNQQSTNYVIQAKYLKRPSFGDLAVPPEINAVVSTITLLMFIPLYDRVIAPRLTVSSIDKMCIGFVLSAMGAACAGLLQLEIEHRGTIAENGDYHLHAGMQRVPFYWQYPLFMVQSMCEVLAGVTAMKLAYLLAPTSMRSVVMSLYLLSSAAGSALGLVVSPWCKPQDYEFLFFAFSGSMLVATVVFYVLFSKKISEKENANKSRVGAEQVPTEFDVQVGDCSRHSSRWSIVS